MHKELVFALTDIRYVCVACKHCKTRVILDLKEEAKFSVDHANAILPNLCPGCRESYDSALRPGIEALQKAYKALENIADRISFRGEAEIAIP